VQGVFWETSASAATSQRKAPTRTPRKCERRVTKGRDGDSFKGRASGETSRFLEKDMGYCL
jgi:hypothetical protein